MFENKGRPSAAGAEPSTTSSNQDAISAMRGSPGVAARRQRFEPSRAPSAPRTDEPSLLSSVYEASSGGFESAYETESGGSAYDVNAAYFADSDHSDDDDDSGLGVYDVNAAYFADSDHSDDDDDSGLGVYDVNAAYFADSDHSDDDDDSGLGVYDVNAAYFADSDHSDDDDDSQLGVYGVVTSSGPEISSGGAATQASAPSQTTSSQGEGWNVQQAASYAVKTLRASKMSTSDFNDELAPDSEDTYTMHELMGWGARTRDFWLGPPRGRDVFSKPHGEMVLVARVTEEALTDDRLSKVSKRIGKFVEPTPYSADETLALAESQGAVQIRDEHVEVGSAGVGAMARASVSNDKDLQKGRFKVNQAERTGYSTIGMDKHHSGMDRKENSKVEYYDTEEARAHTKLTLESGQFTWSESGEAAQGPDLSGMTDQQIYETSPNFVVERQRAVTGKAAKQQAWNEAVAELRAASRLIFVMSSDGEFFATQGEVFRIHHSTMLAGKDVTCAGEIGLSGGKPVYLSNASGHYMPGPAQVWQALHAMAAKGVDVGAVDVELIGLSGTVKGDWLLNTFFPGGAGGRRDLSFEPKRAIEAITYARDVGVDGSSQPSLGTQTFEATAPRRDSSSPSPSGDSGQVVDSTAYVDDSGNTVVHDDQLTNAYVDNSGNTVVHDDQLANAYVDNSGNTVVHDS